MFKKKGTEGQPERPTALDSWVSSDSHFVPAQQSNQGSKPATRPPLAKAATALAALRWGLSSQVAKNTDKHTASDTRHRSSRPEGSNDTDRISGKSANGRAMSFGGGGGLPGGLFRRDRLASAAIAAQLGPQHPRPTSEAGADVAPLGRSHCPSGDGQPSSYRNMMSMGMSDGGGTAAPASVAEGGTCRTLGSAWARSHAAFYGRRPSASSSNGGGGCGGSFSPAATTLPYTPSLASPEGSPPRRMRSTSSLPGLSASLAAVQPTPLGSSPLPSALRRRPQEAAEEEDSAMGCGGPITTPEWQWQRPHVTCHPVYDMSRRLGAGRGAPGHGGGAGGGVAGGGGGDDWELEAVPPRGYQRNSAEPAVTGSIGDITGNVSASVPARDPTQPEAVGPDASATAATVPAAAAPAPAPAPSVADPRGTGPGRELSAVLGLLAVARCGAAAIRGADTASTSRGLAGKQRVPVAEDAAGPETAAAWPGGATASVSSPGGDVDTDLAALATRTPTIMLVLVLAVRVLRAALRAPAVAALCAGAVAVLVWWLAVVAALLACGRAAGHAARVLVGGLYGLAAWVLRVRG